VLEKSRAGEKTRPRRRGRASTELVNVSQIWMRFLSRLFWIEEERENRAVVYALVEMDQANLSESRREGRRRGRREVELDSPSGIESASPARKILHRQG